MTENSQSQKPKRVAVVQSNYLPWRGYFSLINDVDLFIFYDEVKYTKNTWRNRNMIIGPNGPYWITIPIASHCVHNKISEVSIDSDNWKKKHYRSIYQSYKNAPFFNQLEEFLKFTYLESNWNSLSCLNHTTIKIICNMIGCQTELTCSSQFNLKQGRIQRLHGLLCDVKATHYLAGPSSYHYLEPNRSIFEDSGISISYKSYDNLKPYQQQTKEFIPNVSIIDLLANIKLSEICHYL